MKLIVDRFETPAIPGSRALFLRDEAGNILPCQRAVSISQRAGELTTVTVEFLIDGERVVLGGE